MALTVRGVISGSALLAVVAFVAVLVFSPVDGVRRGRVGPPQPVFSVVEQGERIRTAMAESRHLAAINIAEQTAARFPDEPEVWLWKVQAEFVAGQLVEAAETAADLERAVDAEGPPRWPRPEAERSYRLGWASLAQGRLAEARERFAHAAAVYGPATEGTMSEAIRQYNLACYLGMAGQIEAAAEHFALAVDAGYPGQRGNGRGDGGWWRVDPDLDPIRQHRLYLDAVIVLEERERERQEEIRERRRELDDARPDG